MFIRKPIVQGSLLTNAAAVYYTTPSGINTTISSMLVVNKDAAPHTIDVWLCPTSAAAADTDIVVTTKTLAAKESWLVYFSHNMTLSAGGTIQAKADAGAVVNFKCSGTEYNN